jgi:hypothetical protein
MVNAIQRSAAVVVKKSLQEGFGLGVTEAMWKARPIVASAVGGHLEQVRHRHSGLLVAAPLTSARSAMRSSNCCNNRRWPPGSARPRADGLAPCSSTTGTSCAGSRSSARRSSRVPVQAGQRAPRRAGQRTHRPVPPRSILASTTR